MKMSERAHGVKVSDSPPAAVTKGHRVVKTGPVRTNAKDPGFPKKEAPWPKAERKDL